MKRENPEATLQGMNNNPSRAPDVGTPQDNRIARLTNYARNDFSAPSKTGWRERDKLLLRYTLSLSFVRFYRLYLSSPDRRPWAERLSRAVFCRCLLLFVHPNNRASCFFVLLAHRGLVSV